VLRSQSGSCREEIINLLPIPIIEPMFLDLPARNAVTILTELSRLLHLRILGLSHDPMGLHGLLTGIALPYLFI
jgi:hypothetical protein